MLRKVAERELDDSRKLQEICTQFGFTESDIQSANSADSKQKLSLVHEQGEVDEVSVS